MRSDELGTKCRRRQSGVSRYGGRQIVTLLSTNWQGGRSSRYLEEEGLYTMKILTKKLLALATLTLATVGNIHSLSAHHDHHGQRVFIGESGKMDKFDDVEMVRVEFGQGSFRSFEFVADKNSIHIERIEFELRGGRYEERYIDADLYEGESIFVDFHGRRSVRKIYIYGSTNNLFGSRGHVDVYGER